MVWDPVAMVTIVELLTPLWYPFHLCAKFFELKAYNGPIVHTSPFPDDGQTQTNNSSSSNQRGYRRPKVLVLVLGDVGRSPRMQYHALSLVDGGYDVTLCGYAGTSLIPPLRRPGLENLRVMRFEGAPPRWARALVSTPLRSLFFKIPYYFLRSLALHFAVLSRIVGPRSGGYDVILLQNPPAFPTLLIGHVAAYLSAADGYYTKGRCMLLFDWHNLGYSMFPNAGFGRVARFGVRCYERFAGRAAMDWGLAVSGHMRSALGERLSVDARRISVFHDRPPKFFREASPEEGRGVMRKLGLKGWGEEVRRERGEETRQVRH